MIFRRFLDSLRPPQPPQRNSAKTAARDGAGRSRKKKKAGRELLHWTADLSVGHPILDADHEHLCDLLNYLFDRWHAGAPIANLKSLFNELEQSLITHFRNEEEVLRHAQYPDLAQHVAEHEELEREMMNMRQEIEELLRLAPRRNVTKPVLDFLRRVVLKHILSSDMDYRAHLLKKHTF